MKVAVTGEGKAVQTLIRRYQRAEELGIRLVDLDVGALAGYYLKNFPGAPIEALVDDINNLRVPFTVAMSAKIEILSVLTAQRFRKEDRGDVLCKR